MYENPQDQSRIQGPSNIQISFRVILRIQDIPDPTGAIPFPPSYIFFQLKTSVLSKSHTFFAIMRLELFCLIFIKLNRIFFFVAITELRSKFAMKKIRRIWGMASLLRSIRFSFHRLNYTRARFFPSICWKKLLSHRCVISRVPLIKFPIECVT